MSKDLLKASLQATDILILSRDNTVRHLFENAGFRRIRTVRQDLDEGLRIISDGQCDMVVLDDLFLEEKTLKFIQDVRSGKCGVNICLPIVILISDPTNELGRNAVHAGADDVVLKPLSVNDVNKRMSALLTRELLYVVTENYIGPNRRSPERTDPKKDNLVSIPNTMRMKAEGYRETEIQITELMSEANRAIQNISAALDGEIIQNLINEAIANPEEFQSILQKIRPLAAAFAQKVEQTDFKHIGDLCNLLTEIISEMEGPSDSKSTEILALVGQALQLSFKDDVQSKAAAAEIIALLKKDRS